jgi:hypothetical protein
LSHARKVVDPAPGQPDELTDIAFKQIMKGHPAIESHTNGTLIKFFARAQDRPVDYVVFAEVVDGRLDPFRAIPVAAEAKELVDYLAASARHVKSAPAEKFAYFFQFLNHPDVRMSEDAYKEFSKASFDVVSKAASAYDPDRLRQWIRDPNAPAYRIGLFGLLLGIHGRAQDADFLMELVSNPRSRPAEGIDGLMAGLILLRPKEGLDQVLTVINDATAGFKLRYSALLALRFALAKAPGVDHDAAIDRLATALDHVELCDVVIDDLRRQKAWDRLERILSLYDTPSFNIPVIQRTVLRFALECPAEKSKAFVERIRAADAKMVQEVEASLRFDKELQSQFGDF